MTPNTLTIVYVSETEPRLWMWDGSENWQLFTPENLPQAMAWSVFYAPHAVVIDGEAEWLDDALNELLSVTGPSARGRDVIVRVGGAPFALNVPEFIDFVRLPLDVSGEALAHAISAAVQGARLPKVLA